MLKFGIISEVDAAKGVARVTFDQDEIVSDWLPVSVPMTKDDQFQFPLVVNQHVWCMMDEHCEMGVIGGSIYDSNNVPVGGAQNKVRVRFDTDLVIEYDRSSHNLLIDCKGDVNIKAAGDVFVEATGTKVDIKGNAKVEVHAATEIDLDAPLTKCQVIACTSIQPSVSGANLVINANMDLQGNMVATGNVEGAQVKEGSIRLGTHKHLGVTTGGGTSGTPTP